MSVLRIPLVAVQKQGREVLRVAEGHHVLGQGVGREEPTSLAIPDDVSEVVARHLRIDRDRDGRSTKQRQERDDPGRTVRRIEEDAFALLQTGLDQDGGKLICFL